MTLPGARTRLPGPWGRDGGDRRVVGEPRLAAMLPSPCGYGAERPEPPVTRAPAPSRNRGFQTMTDKPAAEDQEPKPAPGQEPEAPQPQASEPEPPAAEAPATEAAAEAPATEAPAAEAPEAPSTEAPPAEATASEAPAA